MGVSLAEIGSADTGSNLGIISWVKSFCHKYLYKASKYFMAFLYLPLNFFLMPYYVVLQFQDAFGWQTQWWVAALIAFAITAYFFILSGLSSKAGDIQNKIITYVKFIPLAFCVVAGITLACCGQGFIGKEGGPTIWPISWGKQAGHVLLNKMYPLLGIIGSIPAIIFSFDGFYSAAGIQSDMAEPKKTPLALVIGLVIVSIIDILISVGLLVGSKNGKINTLGWFDEHGYHWVIAIMEILIGFGILGIINGFAMYNPKYYEDLIKLNELPFANKCKDKINPNKPWVGLVYAGVITLVFFVLFTIIGALAYSDTGGYAGSELIPIAGGKTLIGYDSDGSGHISTLYSFCDLMANWTSIIAFLCIVFAIVGAMKNRKTNAVKVVKVKGFMPCSIVAVIVIGIAMAFIVASTIGNIPIVVGWKADIGATYSEAAWRTDMLGAIMTLVMLFIFLAVCCIPSLVEMKKEKSRGVPPVIHAKKREVIISTKPEVKKVVIKEEIVAQPKKVCKNKLSKAGVAVVCGLPLVTGLILLGIGLAVK